MPTYIYETIPQKPGRKPRQFELQQSMHDAPLTKDPATGESVRRLISGGYGVITQHAAPPAPSCGGDCGCCCENN
ncbi:zinc ribbon domain-containing protein [Opitutus sp. ER46]|uniref:FmdB family zinc ribbon protein n=1 Tax=Opitutus sp. ER46 TaxID=2161864 RepID=UPI000D2F8C54|nr:zinc ribbon domain-containing protein [Opitutus sp. ER46]PTY01074.1 hypothetical protein DB354_00625 [Opitutus sp. ER46]